MNRADVVQEILNRIRGKTYLEIGVSTGESFLPIRARNKVAVDPQFRIPRAKKLRFARNLFSRTRYFEVASDVFFAEHAGFLSGRGVDVALIDGLHTYVQSLRDAENCLRYLNGRGVIVMHDCSPATEAEAKLCGDVWKTIVHLRAARHDLRVFVLNCDYGLGIVARCQPEGKRLDVPVSRISQLSYHDLARNRARYLNLKGPSYLEAFLARL